MAPEKITSLQNPRVKQLVKLRDRRPRDEAGVFLVEGYREIRRALEKGVKLQEIYFSPEWFLGENEPALIAQAEAAGAVAFELTKDAFAKVAYRERPDGLLAVEMGSEQYGLSQFWLENCDVPVRIPMAGQADSLNVAMATIITLFEAVRQRGGG